MESLLEFKSVDYSYHTMSGEVKALSDISFNINAGDFISIVGPSGCGKSTLLSIITGLIKPESGTFSIKKNSTVGYMLQRDNLFEWRDVYSNILLGLEIQDKINPQSIKYVNNMINSYDLGAFKHSRPSELSGGMRQRVALIRTLALKPDILLLDEPFSALDYQTRLEVSNDIGNIIKAEHKTAILVTHDIAEAISMGDKVIILSKRPGRIKKIVPVNINSADRTPFNTRFAPEFSDIFNEIWKEMTSND